MDEPEGQRSKVSSDDSVLLASLLAEPINLEDSYYVQLRGDLEFDAQNLEAESWSLAVDQNYLKALTKEAIKRQEVMYELIQTEMHHVRTLKILLLVYAHELKQSVILDEARLEWLFPGVEALLRLHQFFLNCLKERQAQSQEETEPNNYYITQLGDILINQFSGVLGEKMMNCYSIFCSHHSEAISFYKEQLQNNRKLQTCVRKIGQLPLVRRLGIPECFLLVTQRITKYPVLVERLIQNTEADTDEYRSLVKGLELIKDTISQVDANVREYEKAVRLKEIGLRLEPKTLSRLKDGRLFRREDLIQGNKKLLQEGTVTWKFSGRQKDILIVLLSDMILLLQEKDQKFVFANMDNKPPVISLQKLIVREVAHEDKAMYLICARTVSMPEMYEIHTSSKEECHTWTTFIREAADCHQEQVQYNELIKTLQHFQDILNVRDDQIMQSLTEKQKIFATLYEYIMMQESPHKGLLLRGDAVDLQQGETLLNGAIVEVENLQNLLFMIKGGSRLPIENSRTQAGKLDGGEHFEAADDTRVVTTMKNGDGLEKWEGCEDISVDSKERRGRLRVEEYYSEGLEQSADDETGNLSMLNCNSASTHTPGPAVYNSVMSLAKRLYSLQAVITQQDSMIELQQAFQFKSKQSARHSNVLLEQEKQRNLEKEKEELANLQKQKTQLQEEQQRWEKEKERQRIQKEALEAQLKQKEEECKKWEEKLNEEKLKLERQKEDYQQDLERLRESMRAVDKDKERLAQEKERFEKLKSKLLPTFELSNYDSSQSSSRSPYTSFRGSIVNGAGTLPATFKSQVLPINRSSQTEIPPKVPPRRESMRTQPPKAELPIHLVSTTNQVQKPAVVQQKIPTKLAVISKEKEKSSKGKKSHHRTQSAASIDVNQVLPIGGTGKGGSLKAKRQTSPQRVLTADIFKPPGSAQNIKPSQSFSSNKWNNGDPPPPTPPPFPKEIRSKGKEKVIFF